MFLIIYEIVGVARVKKYLICVLKKLSNINIKSDTLDYVKWLCKYEESIDIIKI